MATVCVPRLTTVDGESVEDVVEVEVTPEVAEVLATPERSRHHREWTCTDLGGRGRGREPLNFDTMADLAGGKRQSIRQIPGGKPWEGGRIFFTLLLGLSRADWHGERSLDELGRCDVCHDAKLGPGVYCLACDNSGRETEIEKPPKSLTAKLTAEIFGGKGLLGGMGSKPRTKKAKKAAKKAAKKGRKK